MVSSIQGILSSITGKYDYIQECVKLCAYHWITTSTLSIIIAQLLTLETKTIQQTGRLSNNTTRFGLSSILITCYLGGGLY